MLVLSRKVGERILIGDEIAVTVVRVTGGGVRIGIEAPAEMPVIREELKPGLSGKPPARPAVDSADQISLREKSG
jgi:carbon storage regulator